MVQRWVSCTTSKSIKVVSLLYQNTKRYCTVRWFQSRNFAANYVMDSGMIVRNAFTGRLLKKELLLILNHLLCYPISVKTSSTTVPLQKIKGQVLVVTALKRVDMKVLSSLTRTFKKSIGGGFLKATNNIRIGMSISKSMTNGCVKHYLSSRSIVKGSPRKLNQIQLDSLV